MEPFQIVERAVFAPQADILGYTDGPLIDTGVERYGDRIYLGPRAYREVTRITAPDMCSIKERDEALERAKGAQTRADAAEAHSQELAGRQAEHERTRAQLINTQAELAALKNSYAVLEAGGTKTPHERVIEAAKPKPPRKRPAAVKT